MLIEQFTVRRLKMRMKEPFSTSFGTMQDKQFLLIEVKDELGNCGWGESVAFEAPWYTEETVETNWHMIRDFLIPLLIGKELSHPDQVGENFSSIRGNNMAKAAVEGAVWDLYAKRNNLSLAESLGGGRAYIDVGISIGLQQNLSDLIEKVRMFLDEGYKRIKVKIKPGADVELLRRLRAVYPDVPLMADANSAYTLDDIDLLKQLDDFGLLMIEQPLGYDDIVDHSILQKELKTPICLDESIHSLADARKAIALGSTKIINIKIGRVGGLSEAKKIHDYCMDNGIPVWCGGMLEAGIGRAHNIALTSLPNFILPGDTAGSSRYWEKDIITPEVTVQDGKIKVPVSKGIGFTPNLATIEEFTVGKWHFTK
ncbi:o-succinylbenzoate synthase [Sporosarcina oncorhynchi]|uniref:o-succinylbenzoate synthase n=1 Tax=Sporosarcina oncorhynchi TaxID=3056444 RepID=A0ABZ0LBD9_9BACL|nr:o-succinylbenzoate synthase [Sporosarcina sp. T2O-4]WOV89052.1 o-succinylbenzoate synthase [Sporosarcina sp. T2O-4]